MSVASLLASAGSVKRPQLQKGLKMKKRKKDALEFPFWNVLARSHAHANKENAQSGRLKDIQYMVRNLLSAVRPGLRAR